MSQRPQIVIWDDRGWSDSALAALRNHADIVYVANADEAVKLLVTSDFAGVIPAIDASAVPVPTSPIFSLAERDDQRVLDFLVSGVAVVDEELSLRWYNRSFMEMCEGAAETGANVVDALGCTSDSEQVRTVFTACRQTGSPARVRVCLSTDRHVEITAQPAPHATETPARTLCVIRDATSEVQQHEKLLAIHRAGIELSHLTPDELAEMSASERRELLKANILQYSLNILNFKSFEIRLLDPETNVLHILISEGMTHHSQERELYASEEGNGVTGFVASTGRSYHCADVRNDPLYIPGALDARSSLTVPIVYREEIIGTFNVESPEPNHFTDSDRDFLEVFAREIAVGLNTLALLRAEKSMGGSASVEAILGEVGIPADEIVTDAIAILGMFSEAGMKGNAANEAIRRVLVNARAIKSSIQSIRENIERSYHGTEYEATLFAGRRVLLADSDPEIRRSAHLLLGKVHCTVDTAKTGTEAISLAHDVGYDVILGDIRLPDLNGYEFFRGVKQAAPKTPVVLMTGFGYDASHSIVNARQEGLAGILYKPFRLDRLCETLEEALDPATRARHVPSVV